MADKAFERAYRIFYAIYGDSRPVREPDELARAIEAAGLDSSEVTPEWLSSLNQGWVYYEEEAPFTDDFHNREYRRLAQWR